MRVPYRQAFLKSLRAGTISFACFLCLFCHSLGAADVAASSTSASETSATRPLKVAVVNFRKCVEASKQGKQHQSAFEGMKTQMETLLQQKEKALTELNNKLNDNDYLDGLTKETQNELKHKFRMQGQELSQAQQQFMQTLQQANLKIVEMMSNDVSKAAAEVARAQGYDFVLNEESLFYYNPKTDISDAVVVEMNKAYDIEQKKNEAAKGKTPSNATLLPENGKLK